MHDVLAAELVRVLRGRRSQRALNRRLGRASNVAHTWERGRRAPRASDFFRLARLAGVDVETSLRAFGAPLLANRAPVAFGRRSLSDWLAVLTRTRSQADLARKIGRDRNTVARWLTGATEPRLPDLLRLVEATTQRLMDFVASFVDPASLPSIRAAYGDLALQRRIAYELPWAHAVLRVLELEAYRRLSKHEPGFIARHIGLEPNAESDCLQALARAGQIERRRGKWAVRRVLTVDTGQDRRANLTLKRHWAEVALRRIGTQGIPDGSLYSYNLFAISDEGLAAIREAHLLYFERLRAIVAECRNPTRLALANVQLVPLDVLAE
jgi:transcriptional regulator with XRE-family HTH domain